MESIGLDWVRGCVHVGMRLGIIAQRWVGFRPVPPATLLFNNNGLSIRSKLFH